MKALVLALTAAALTYSIRASAEGGKTPLPTVRLGFGDRSSIGPEPGPTDGFDFDVTAGVNLYFGREMALTHPLSPQFLVAPTVGLDKGGDVTAFIGGIGIGGGCPMFAGLLEAKVLAGTWRDDWTFVGGRFGGSVQAFMGVLAFEGGYELDTIEGVLRPAKVFMFRLDLGAAVPLIFIAAMG
ncbi:MAG: hypothetical protein U0271_10180 [Polyangiaceae bacterium]